MIFYCAYLSNLGAPLKLNCPAD